MVKATGTLVVIGSYDGSHSCVHDIQVSLAYFNAHFNDDDRMKISRPRSDCQRWL